jgi:hypothetical protein
VTSADRGGPRRGRVPLAGHVGALVLILGLALALTERGSGFTADEGSYAMQAEAVAGGQWEIEWPFRSADPEARHFPYHGGRITADEEYAYVSHPAWPAVLSVARGVGPEEVGLRLVPLASVVVAAMAGWGVARYLGGAGAAPWAFWVVGTSPILADGLMLWAHAPAAAAAGLAVLAALIVSERGRRPWWIVLGGSVVVGVLLRSESLLFAGALAGTLGLAGLRRRDPRLLGAGVLSAMAALGALAAERQWISSIAGDAGRGLAARGDGEGWLAGRVEGAGIALLEGADASTAGTLCSTAALGLVVLAAVSLVRGPGRGGPPTLLLLGGAAVLTGLRLVVAPDDPVAGLLVAWPVAALVGAGITGSSARTRVLLLGTAAYALAVLITQYDDGGGLQWGGRYLAPLVVPVGAVVGGVIATHLRDRSRRQAVAALLCLTAVLGLVVTDQVRRSNADAMDQLASVDSDIVLVAGEQLARLDWAHWPERCWLSDGATLREALDVLERAGSRRVAYLGFSAETLAAAGARGTPLAPDSVLGEAEVGTGEGPGTCPVP